MTIRETYDLPGNEQYDLPVNGQYDLARDEQYARPDYYPPGYREDEELYVYDQSCDNCAFHDTEACPMKISSGMSRGEYWKREKRRKEDAAMRGGEPQWCIYWQGRRRGKRYR